MSAAQRIALGMAAVLIIAFGLVLVGLNWPMMREITHISCDPYTGECKTITRPYKVGNEGATFFGIFLVAFGLLVLGILLLHYVKLMFSTMLKLLRRMKLTQKL